MPDLKTMPQIARELNERPHRVKYVIESYRIEETARVANVRLFDATAVDTIRRYLRRTSAVSCR